MASHLRMAGGSFRFVRGRGWDDEEIDILEDGMTRSVREILGFVGEGKDVRRRRERLRWGSRRQERLGWWFHRRRKGWSYGL
ncbi:hypothetical protein COP1_014494 [Malus domestica]